jgi:Putative metallopeptidase
MSRNLFNLFAVFLLLLVVTACVCNSDRFGGKSTPVPDSTPSVEKTSKDQKPDDKGGRTSPEKDKGDFIVEHVAVKNPKYEELDESITQGKTLEKAAERLNRALSLPNDIALRTKDCDQINAFYDPGDSSVTVCYELMEHFFKVFKSNGDNDKLASQKMSEAVQFVFLHEIGHALIDTYKLPITANEEDAADRLSSYVNLEELGEDGVNAVFSAAEAFRIESQGKVPSAGSLADEHLLQEQRFYNALCMLYGSNMQKYSDIVEKGFLPEARAVRCPTEYERTVESWVKILEPWRKK